MDNFKKIKKNSIWTYVARLSAFAIIFLGFFSISITYPLWADDYSLINAYHAAGFFHTAINYYLTWMGNISFMLFQYVAIYIMAEHEIAFSVLNAAFFLLFVVSIFRLIARKIPRDIFDFLFLFLIAFLFILLPTGGGEVYFWRTGATAYFWPLSLGIWLLVSCRDFINFCFLKKISVYFVAILVAMGSTQLAIAMAGVLMFVLYDFYKRERKLTPAIWVGAIIYFIFMGVCIFSPGNSVRATALSVNKGVIDLALMYFDRPISSLLNQFRINTGLALLFLLSIFSYAFIMINDGENGGRSNDNNKILIFYWAVFVLGLAFFHQVAVPWLLIEGRVAFLFEAAAIFFILMNSYSLLSWVRSYKEGALLVYGVMFLIFYYGSISLWKTKDIMSYVSAVDKQRLTSIKYNIRHGACVDDVVHTYPLKVPGLMEKVNGIYSNGLIFVFDITSDATDWRNFNFTKYYGLDCNVAVAH